MKKEIPVTMTGTLDANKFFNTLAAIIGDREKVKISVTVSKRNKANCTDIIA